MNPSAGCPDWGCQPLEDMVSQATQKEEELDDRACDPKGTTPHHPQQLGILLLPPPSQVEGGHCHRDLTTSSTWATRCTDWGLWGCMQCSVTMGSARCPGSSVCFRLLCLRSTLVANEVTVFQNCTEMGITSDHFLIQTISV